MPNLEHNFPSKHLNVKFLYSGKYILGITGNSLLQAFSNRTGIISHTCFSEVEVSKSLVDTSSYVSPTSTAFSFHISKQLNLC